MTSLTSFTNGSSSILAPETAKEEEGDEGEDPLAALDALEKEALEFKKVRIFLFLGF